MKVKILCLAAIMTAVLMASPVLASDYYFGVLSYQVALPYGDTKEFTDQTSWRGAGISFNQFLNKSASVGIEFDWNVFHKTTSDPIAINIGSASGTASGKQDRTINAFPMLLKADLYAGSAKERFFAGLGIGPYYIERRLQLGVYARTEGEWHFGVAPEIGYMYRVGYGTGAQVALQYHYVAEAGGFTEQWLALKLGVTWGR